MATIQLPAGFVPREFSLEMSVNQRAFASPFNGSEQVVDQLNDRWLISMTMPSDRTVDGAAMEAFIGSMRGMVNTVNLWHFVRPVPRGTLRGSPTVYAPLFRGDPNIQVVAPPGTTVLAGDLVGCAGALFMASQDAVANGSSILDIRTVNRSRVAASAGTPVVWNKPTASFRLMSKSSIQYLPGYAAGASFDFAEAI